MLTVNRNRFFAAPALRVKVCICRGSGDIWKWYWLSPKGGMIEIGPVAEFTANAAVNAASLLHRSILNQALRRLWSRGGQLEAEWR